MIQGEWVSEVEMFAGCLKEDVTDAMEEGR